MPRLGGFPALLPPTPVDLHVHAVAFLERDSAASKCPLAELWVNNSRAHLEHLPVSIGQRLAAMASAGLPCARGALGTTERSLRRVCSREGGAATGSLLQITGNWKRGAVITCNYSCNYSSVITAANYR